jgi:hypothetical protein
MNFTSAPYSSVLSSHSLAALPIHLQNEFIQFQGELSSEETFREFIRLKIISEHVTKLSHELFHLIANTPSLIESLLFKPKKRSLLICSQPYLPKSPRPQAFSTLPLFLESALKKRMTCEQTKRGFALALAQATARNAPISPLRTFIRHPLCDRPNLVKLVAQYL